MEQYLKEHMLTPEVIAKYGLKVGNDIIEIPIKDPQGNYLFSKYRVFNKPMKYLYEKGSQMALFNAEKITSYTNEVWIVEGEFDAIALQEFLNNSLIVVVSSTGGAGSWNMEWNELLVGKEVHILLDNDSAGKKGSIKLWEIVFNADVCKLKEQYKDVCEMIYDSNGNFRQKTIFRIPRNNITSLKYINEVLSFLDEDDLVDGSNREFNDLMRTKLGEMYQKKKIDNRRKVDNTEEYEPHSQDIVLLKQIPITNFIQFKYGVAKCIFHNENNPSMHYNDFNSKIPNTVKCYSCGKFGDVIEVIMALENVDFKGALEYLRNYHG